MHILSLENVEKSYGMKKLFDQATFGIDKNEKVGFIGVNGAGKSTLLKIIAGVLKPDSGAVYKTSKIHIHYMPQEPQFTDGHTVLECVLDGELPVMTLLRDYEHTLRLVEEMPENDAHQAKLLALTDKMDQTQAWEMEQQAKVILTKLGFTEFQRSVELLSGGQRKRLELARALIRPCDLLVLDEPTNHLDQETIQWLEQYLTARKGALVLSTHDRYFLDSVVTSMIELDKQKIYKYTGNYSDYLAAREERLVSDEASADKRHNLLRQEQAWMQRGARARSTKQKARIDRYEKLVATEKGKSVGQVEMIDLSSRLGRTILSFDKAGYHYEDGGLLFKELTYEVTRHDRIGIVGVNGAGKTTLLKLVAGQLVPTEGSVLRGQTVKIAWFTQELPEFDEKQKVIEYIKETGGYITNQSGQTISAAQLLEQFLFTRDMQWTPLHKLSGGEKRRLFLLRLLMTAPNVLLLDEPTNDLDIPTLTVLEEYLDTFQGVVIVVSHDRYFLDRVVDKIFAIENCQIERFHGDYTDYLAEKGKNSKAANTNNTGIDDKRNEAINGIEPNKKRKLTMKEEAELAYITKELPNYERMLKGIELAIASAGSDFDKVEVMLTEQNTVKANVDAMVERWCDLQALIEAYEE